MEDNDIDRNMAGYKKANSISDARNQILVAKEPFFCLSYMNFCSINALDDTTYFIKLFTVLPG